MNLNFKSAVTADEMNLNFKSAVIADELAFMTGLNTG